MSQNELTATVKRIQELKRMQEEIAAELETLTDAVKAEMTERNASDKPNVWAKAIHWNCT